MAHAACRRETDAEALLGRLGGLRAAMRGRAAAHDAAASFPGADIAALREIGLLGAVLPLGQGGLGLGTEPEGARALARALRLLGSASLAVGRLFEAHVNAIRLIARRGSPAQLGRAAALLREGAVFALWVTDPPEGALIADAAGRLRGGKAFCSGAGHVSHVVVTLRDPAGDTRLAMLATAGARAEALPMRLQGMRAATTGRVAFDGMRIAAADWFGAPGDYLAEPDFSAGAWRTSAVLCGGLEALVALAMAQLVARGRDGDPHQRARMGRAWIARETAVQWLGAVAAVAEGEGDAADIVARVGFARIAIEEACAAAVGLVERSLGLAAFLQPSPVELVRRDLATYLRQPAADEVLSGAAAHAMRRAAGAG